MCEFHLYEQGLRRTLKSLVSSIITFARWLYVYMPLNYPWSLLVIVWLDITGISGEPTVLEGDNLQLTCEASGRPKPNITWTKEKPGNQGNTGGVQEGRVLIITNINGINAGTYTCTAYNGFGKPKNRTVYVNVTCEYAFKKSVWIMLNRDALSFYFLCCNVLCCQLLGLMFGQVHPCRAPSSNFQKPPFGDWQFKVVTII